MQTRFAQRAIARLGLFFCCAALAGCATVSRSNAWNTATKPLNGKLQTDECVQYAKTLGTAFKEANIPYHIAYIQWRSGLGDLTTKRGTSGLHAIVLYRDDTNIAYPWWGVDNEGEPIWLRAQDPLSAAYEFGYSTGADYVRVESIDEKPRTRLGKVLFGKRPGNS